MAKRARTVERNAVMDARQSAANGVPSALMREDAATTVGAAFSPFAPAPQLTLE
jgi:hypothetical protein